MDRDFIKTIISTKDGKDDRLIKRGDLIDLELFDILCSAPISKIDKVFYKYDDNASKDIAIYYMQIKCPICGNVREETVCKTNITDTIKKMKSERSKKTKIASYFSSVRLLCSKCENKRKEQERIESEKYQKKFAEENKKKNENYVTLYLDNNRSFNKDASPKIKIFTIMKKETFFSENYFLDDEYIQSVIKKMSYNDFLKTPYWDGVRNYKLKKSGYCCELCKKKGVLNVHRKNYENHGLEHIEKIADKDLIVLCKDCHKKFHDKVLD